MKLQDIILEARARFSDTAAPYFWTNAQWADVANEAQREACRRARLLVDSSTPEITKLSVSPAKLLYALDERIIFIKRVKLAANPRPLPRRLVRTMDANHPGWEDDSGDPQAYIPDFTSGHIRLWPLASAPDVVRLTVIRMPLEDMNVDNQATVSPEINVRYHLSLIDWMLYRAYNRQDVDTYDERKAALYLSKFESQFGVESSAVNETWQNQHQGEDADEGQY